jgi:hypothetical protein
MFVQVPVAAPSEHLCTFRFQWQILLNTVMYIQIPVASPSEHLCTYRFQWQLLLNIVMYFQVSLKAGSLQERISAAKNSCVHGLRALEATVHVF